MSLILLLVLIMDMWLTITNFILLEHNYNGQLGLGDTINRNTLTEVDTSGL